MPHDDHPEPADEPANEPDERITLKDAAARLGLHYMTVYRYVRLGRLPAEREGGEWRVQLADARRVAGEAAQAPRGRKGRPDTESYRERILGRLLEGDETGAWNVCTAALAAGMEPQAIYLDLLAPNLEEIGRRWAAGELEVADEHRASAVVHRLIGRLGPRFTRRGRRAGTIVVGGAPGDHHHLPLALLADLLRGAGYRVIDLGADVPSASFVSAVAAAPDVVAVGVSACTVDCLGPAGDTLEALRSAFPALPLLLGGPAVDDLEVARALGADAYAADGVAAVACIDALVGRSRTR